MRYCLSGLKRLTKLHRYRHAELKKYGPPSMLWFLSSMQVKIMLKKPLAHRCRLMWPLGSHLEEIHPRRAFSVGQKPMNLPIKAWSFIYWILSLIRCTRSLILVLVVALGMHVEEVMFAAYNSIVEVSFAGGVALFVS